MNKYEMRARLITANNKEEVIVILNEAGQAATPEVTERIWQEIEHDRNDGKRKLDRSEMDAVVGGEHRD